MTIQEAAVNYYPKCESPTLIVTLNEDDIIEREQQAFTAGSEWMRGEMEKEIIKFVDSLRDYTKESHKILGFDERTTSEFYQIYKQKP